MIFHSFLYVYQRVQLEFRSKHRSAPTKMGYDSTVLVCDRMTNLERTRNVAHWERSRQEQQPYGTICDAILSFTHVRKRIQVILSPILMVVTHETPMYSWLNPYAGSIFALPSDVTEAVSVTVNQTIDFHHC